MNKEKFNRLFETEPVPLQDKSEFSWLVQKVESIKPSVIVEIGISRGGSLKFWDECITKDGLVIGIDITDNIVDKEYIKTLSKVILLISDSTNIKTVDALKKILKERRIDFLFIDGLHEEEGITKDYTLYSPLVRQGGLIGFHDAGEPSQNYHNVPDATLRWERGGDPAVRKLFNSIKHEKEVIQYNQGTGIVYV